MYRFDAYTSEYSAFQFSLLAQKWGYAFFFLGGGGDYSFKDTICNISRPMTNIPVINCAQCNFRIPSGKCHAHLPTNNAAVIYHLASNNIT